MSDLSTLPWPEGSPHFIVVNSKRAFLKRYPFKATNLIDLDDIGNDPLECTIICAVAEAWFRQQADKYKKEYEEIYKVESDGIEYENLQSTIKLNQHFECRNAARAWANTAKAALTLERKRS